MNFRVFLLFVSFSITWPGYGHYFEGERHLKKGGHYFEGEGHLKKGGPYFESERRPLEGLLPLWERMRVFCERRL